MSTTYLDEAERAVAELPDLDPTARHRAVVALLRFLRDLAGGLGWIAQQAISRHANLI